ncbi:MAG TPA: hypothetical protein VNL18_07690 [Gemmatimonadales bacterium]|nr:hypothetical protein [Gemmatimonadales bacterium]
MIKRSYGFRLLPLLTGIILPRHNVNAQVVTAHTVLAMPTSSVRFDDTVERSDGYWAGLELELRAGLFTLTGSGTRGELTPTVNPLLDRNVGELRLAGRYDVLSWLGAEARYVVRASSSLTGHQRWEFYSLGARVLRDLGAPGLSGSAALAYSPTVRVSGLEDPRYAVSADAGIAFAPERSPLTVRLSYRIERFRFPSTTARSEQFEALTLAVGLRARRQHGRWALGGAP